MTVVLAGFRVGIAELAILGLLFPAECDDLPVWSEKEREVFRQAALLVLKEGEIVKVPPGDGQNALTEAQWAVNDQASDWWPYTWREVASDGPATQQVHDLTLPVLWGIEWLLPELERRRFAYEDPAIRTACNLIQQAKARLDVLRDRQGGFIDDVPTLHDACERFSDALHDRCPVLMAWPSLEPEPV
ncbi:hypothetical protein [Gluconobacter japonicus]|uniref:hypothetical protein n=1 Tax=Gluconobacter japonicus TaxID=376620 RepID=UPI000782092D|nr:hypothetical protein [Gluconobacter japonicus]KXV21865.1 hypothetical protein AD935_05930 [Gluconobacter japonicus]